MRKRYLINKPLAGDAKASRLPVDYLEVFGILSSLRTRNKSSKNVHYNADCKSFCMQNRAPQARVVLGIRELHASPVLVFAIPQ